MMSHTKTGWLKQILVWDVNVTYKDRMVKTNTWKKLGLLFNKNDFKRSLLQKQFKTFKDTLKKYLDKRNRMTRSGAAASNLPKYKFFDQMAFLHEKSANKPTESNVDTVPDFASTSSFHSQCSFSPLSSKPPIKKKALITN